MSAQDSADPRLRRDIGPLGSAALVFNGLVGTGIFAAPAILLVRFGDWSPWVFPLFGVITLSIVIGFARAAAMFEGSGGPVAYARAAFGPLASFQVGWVYYVARVSAYAANTLVFVEYAGALAPVLDAGWPKTTLILVVIGGLAWLNASGVKSATRALDAVTVFKGLPLLIAAIAGLVLFAPNLNPPGPAPDLPALEASALFIFYAFIGFETSVVPAGETRDPRKTIPRTLVMTVCATAALYFLVQYAYTAVMAEREVGENVRPLVAFADVLFGPVGGTIMALTALFSVAGNSMGSMLSTPRITFALAKEGAFPAWFAGVSQRSGAPANSIWFMGGVAAILAVTGGFVWLAVMSTLARLLVYFSTMAALPVARLRSGVASRATLSLDAAFAVLGGLVCLWAISQATWQSWRALLILAVFGLALFAAGRILGERD